MPFPATQLSLLLLFSRTKISPYFTSLCFQHIIEFIILYAVQNKLFGLQISLMIHSEKPYSFLASGTIDAALTAR